MMLVLLFCGFSSLLFSSQAQVSQMYVAPLSIDVSQCYIPMEIQYPYCNVSRKLALSPVHHKIKQQKQKEIVELEEHTAKSIVDWQKRMKHTQDMKKSCCCSQAIQFFSFRNT